MVVKCMGEKENERERETDRQTDRQTETDRHTDTHTQTGRQTEKKTNEINRFLELNIYVYTHIFDYPIKQSLANY